MIVLAIETSCDDTSVAIIDEKKIYASIISSQSIHNDFGGVVPELASREHLKNIDFVFQQALEEAKLSLSDIDAFAVTYGPGLAGALIVGLNFVKGLSLACQKPFIGINHLEGHLASNYLANPKWKAPYIALLVSGGHSQLIHVKSYFDFELLGTSLDDAVGEAFDKSAKLLALGYPGGPLIDQLAKKGNASAIPLPRPYLNNKNFDFSFSGLKTAVSNYVKKNPQLNKADLCASFQKAAIDSLMIKLKRAATAKQLKRVAIAGGVSANSYLRQEINALKSEGYEINLPALSYCTDNAAMIAKAALLRLKHGYKSDYSLSVKPILALDTNG